MSIPEVLNRTPCAFSPLFLADEIGRQLLVLVARVTFSIDAAGRLRLSDEQMGINPAGEFWAPNGPSSYKHEPDAAFIKVGTDVVLLGHAYPQRSDATSVDVELRLGLLEKTVRVFGDRYWVNGLSGPRMTRPAPFERMPLRYERAFGGWDRSHEHPEKHSFEPRNPLGTGFRTKDSRVSNDVMLPNLEDPRVLIRECHDRPAPACFGFTSPDWQPRATFAGTYDAAWEKDRRPWLPVDFDRRYFNGASAGLVAPGYLKGNEPVRVRGATPDGELSFRLPGIPPIAYAVRLLNEERTVLTSNLDTVVIDGETSCLHLTWRAVTTLRRGAQDVDQIEIGLSGRM